MLALVLAGEAVFLLPFHVSRHFRPTFVGVFGIDQAQLGTLGAIYGAVAAFAYVVGGAVADRYPPGRLLAGSLVATGLGGLYLLTVPSYAGLCGLFAYWGLTTIVPFWSALIRATRDWGGGSAQGSAFGLLDGGRGATSALLGLFALGLFAVCFPDGGEDVTPARQLAAIRQVIGVYTVACFGAAAAAWALIPTGGSGERSDRNVGAAALRACLGRPEVWLQAVVIAAAYTLFKSRDIYAQYAADVWGWSEVEAAKLSTQTMWARPAAAVAAGLLADRVTAWRVVAGSFVVTGVAATSLLFAPSTGPTALLWLNVATLSGGAFALRGVYFALLEESAVPREITGAAVGVISFVGFTPEIYMPLFTGRVIDAWQGAPGGYAVIFGLLLAASVVGLGATATLGGRIVRNRTSTD
ncbi:MAG: MFS transporter [Planctomycetota bacterium]